MGSDGGVECAISIVIIRATDHIFGKQFTVGCGCRWIALHSSLPQLHAETCRREGQAQAQAALGGFAG